MDSGACAKFQSSSQSFSEKLDEVCNKRSFSEKLDAVCNKRAVQHSTVADGTAPPEPITPVPNRELVDCPFDNNSPLTDAKRPTKVSCFDSKTTRKDEPVACVDDDSSPRTPTGVVFDPFAPGPDNMAMAPLCKKYIDQMRSSVARRLNFDPSLKLVEDKTYVDDVKSISDEEMFESVYNNLLEAIVSQQTEGLLAEILNVKRDSEFCKTPPVPHLNGVAETCPGAPMKPSTKSRKIDLGLCRKLEF